MFLDADGEDLLEDLMAALNAFAKAGMPVTVKDGKLESRAGVVVPSTRGRWASRPLIPSLASRPWPASLPLGEDRDEDGF